MPSVGVPLSCRFFISPVGEATPTGEPPNKNAARWYPRHLETALRIDLVGTTIDAGRARGTVPTDPISHTTSHEMCVN